MKNTEKSRREPNYETRFIKKAEEAGWEISQGDDYCDVVLKKDGRPAIAVEIKTPQKWNAKNRKGETPLRQAERYAAALGAPVALATDSNRFLYSHMKDGRPLTFADGTRADALITPGEYDMFADNSRTADVDEERLAAAYKKINSCMMQLGVESGIKRAIELSKIIFVKMLSERGIIAREAWDVVKTAGHKKRAINAYIKEISETVGKLPVKEMQLDVNEEKRPLDEIVGELSRFSFHRAKSDVHGVAFQQFWKDRSNKGGGTNDLGQYFTPPPVVSAICAMADMSKSDSVYGPFCGTGGILVSAFKAVQQKEKLAAAEAKQYGGKNLFGTEISASAALVAKMNMVLAGDGHTNIHAGDSLNVANNVFIKDGRRFDFVITNMPFKPHKSDSADDADYYQMSGGCPPICNCVEHCINRTKPGGKLFIVAPQGILSNLKKPAFFRETVLGKYRLDAVIQLPEKSFAPYNASDASILCMTNLPPEEDGVIRFRAAETMGDLADAAAEYGSGRFAKFEAVKTSRIAANKHILIPGQYPPKPKHRIGDFAGVADNRAIKTNNAGGRKMMEVPSDRSIRIIPCRPKKGGETYKHPLQKGAVVVKNIINKRKHEAPSVGVGIVDEDSEGHLVTQEYHQLIPKNPAHLGFLYCFLTSPAFQHAAVRQSTGTGHKRIGDIRNIGMPKPTPALIQKCNDHIKRVAAAQKELARLMAVKFKEFD